MVGLQRPWPAEELLSTETKVFGLIEQLQVIEVIVLLCICMLSWFPYQLLLHPAIFLGDYFERKCMETALEAWTVTIKVFFLLYTWSK